MYIGNYFSGGQDRCFEPPSDFLAATVSKHNKMRKLLFIAILICLTSSIYSQEIYRKYEFKELKTSILKKIKYHLSGKEKYTYKYEIEIFEDKTFKSNETGTDGMMISFIKNGIWQINKDTLVLRANKIKIERESDWKETDEEDMFLIKKKKIIPIIEGKLDRKRKLRQI